MIEKLLEIRRLGRFFEGGPSIDFEPLTLIQGLNGTGKTTLAAIFRSLALDEPRYLLERRTLGTTESPEIKLRIDGDIYTFSEGHWDRAFRSIAVFDSTFINENVHSGFEIHSEQRRQLFQFILGEQPVQTARAMDEVEASIRETSKRIKEYDKRPYLRGAMTLSLFSQLKIDPELESKRQQLLNRLTALESREPLKEAPLLQTLRLPQFALQELRALLAQSFADLQADAQGAVQAWISRLGHGSEHWLSEGLQHLKHLEEAHCPFCTQPVSQVELIRAYDTYFNQAYRQHQQQLDLLAQSLETLLPESILVSWQHLLSANRQAHAHWSRYGNLPECPEPDLASLWQQMHVFRQTLSELIVCKRSQPMNSIEIPEQLETCRDDLLATVSSYRQHVAEVNQAIGALRLNFQEEDPEPLRRQLALMELHYQRQQPAVQQDIEAWQELMDNKAQLAEQKEALREQLKEETAAVFSRCMTRLNKYLYHFGTGLRLSELRDVHVGGKPNLDYAFRHQRGEVKLTSPRQPAPSWRNVLSEGDKQSLGLAFFLAQLEEYPAQIIVLDDPSVGLDNQRVQTLHSYLEQLRQNGSQVIILSHQSNWAEAFEREPILLDVN
jgi:wobble nucleotide-excising tRNase